MMGQLFAPVLPKKGDCLDALKHIAGAWKYVPRQ
jgi:hypothetical protein